MRQLWKRVEKDVPGDLSFEVDDSFDPFTQ